MYDLRVLDGTDDVGTWLEILFSNQCGHLPALGSEGTMIEEKGMQIAHQAPKVKTSVGLALSGGGARGLAHIGVLKVFEKAGIQIDCLAGSSMGGIIAAAYAAGWSPRALEKESLHMRSVRQLAGQANGLRSNAETTVNQRSITTHGGPYAERSSHPD